jgi:hypothetical protein
MKWMIGSTKRRGDRALSRPCSVAASIAGTGACLGLYPILTSQYNSTTLYQIPDYIR